MEGGREKGERDREGENERREEREKMRGVNGNRKG